MRVSFLAQGTGRKLVTGFLLFVFTVSSVMPGYAANDHLRPPAVKNSKQMSEAIARDVRDGGLKQMADNMNRFFGLNKEQAVGIDGKLARVSFDGEENRLGWTPAMFDWIFSPEGRTAVDSVLADADTIKRQYKYVIFCGMGGSGLSVQAVKTIFGENEGVRIYSLRTTDPAVIKDILDQISGHENGSLDQALEKTLVIPISKSGTTLETKTHKEYFEKLFSARKMDIDKHMWVMTDKGSPLDLGVYPQREIQLNGRGDVGGRFTAPTTRVFLTPLSLVAHDKVWPVLERTRSMIDGKDKNLSLDSFIAFGRRAYELASREHKDKLTLILPEELKDFSIWSEQLVEESIGHDGKGITVVYGEDLSPEVLKSAADNDRFFVRVNIGGKETRGDIWKYLTDNKYPVQEFDAADIVDIGSLMLGFQMAVATVGYLWDICFVDQPGVKGYKDATNAVQEKLGAGATVQIPSEWVSGKFRSLNVHYGTLLRAGVLTLAELEAETVRLGGSMSDMPVVYAAALNLLRGKFELAEIASYGRLTPSTRRVFEDARYAIFTRNMQKASKLGEGPDKNHSYHQNIAQGRDIFNSLYFMPLVMEQPELAYDDNLIRAQTVGTIQSLVDTGRKVVLVTSDSTADEAAEDLRMFFDRVDIVLRGGAEVRDGGVVTGQDINVLSTLFSLQEGAQTGGYNIEHAILEGADGFILNHSEPRGRMENKMENLLRGVRDLLNQKASPATIDKVWVETLKTENLSADQISAMRPILDSFMGNRRTQKAIELNARSLVNKVVNFQLKKIIAYSDKYNFRQVVLCIGETRAQKDSGLTQQVLAQDIREMLDGITAEQAVKINLRQAYEPRWAINQTPAITPDPQSDIQPTHRFIKDTTAGVLESELSVDYGGSLNEGNADKILPLPDVNGGLIGGAAKQPKKIGLVIDTAIEVGEKTGKLLNIGMNWKAENETSGLADISEFAGLFNSKDLTKVQITLSTPIVSRVRSSLAAGVKDGGKFKTAAIDDTAEVPLVQPQSRYSESLTRAIIAGNNENIYKQFATKEYVSFMKSVEQVDNASGALVVGGNVLLDNAGSIRTLEQLKKTQPGIKIVVWAGSGEMFSKLKTLGVDGIADIMADAGLKDVLSRLTTAQIPANRIVLINTQSDENLLRQDFARMAKLFMDYSGIKVVKIKDAAVSAGRPGRVNMMPLAVARAVASILSDRKSVVGEYRKMLYNYKNRNIISESDMAALGDLTESLAEIPLVTVDKEIADMQVMYAETLNKI